MGVLLSCYQIADLALVCGSFTDRVGGHNIFEPILLGVPVFFGPHMHSQRDLRDLVKLSGSGKQVTIDELFTAVESYISSPSERKVLREHCLVLREEVKGAIDKTWRESSSIFERAFN
jgi:3-deoxy-D-manno-octulosonic-acid transferase